MDIFNKDLKSLLIPSINPIGFIDLKNGSFYYEDELISEHFRIGAMHNSVLGNYTCSIGNYSRRIKIISSYWEDLSTKLSLVNGLETISVDPHEEGKRICSLELRGTKKSIQAVTTESKEKLLFFYKNMLFPTMDNKSNIQSLNQEYNSPFDKEGARQYWFIKLIVAKLAGNLEYNNIYEYVVNYFREGIEETADSKKKRLYQTWIECFEEVNNRLKEVQPLTDPYLGSPILREKVLNSIV